MKKISIINIENIEMKIDFIFYIPTGNHGYQNNNYRHWYIKKGYLMNKINWLIISVNINVYKCLFLYNSTDDKTKQLCTIYTLCTIHRYKYSMIL